MLCYLQSGTSPSYHMFEGIPIYLTTEYFMYIYANTAPDIQFS